jgi:hypothetical protein
MTERTSHACIGIARCGPTSRSSDRQRGPARSPIIWRGRMDSRCAAERKAVSELIFDEYKNILGENPIRKSVKNSFLGLEYGYVSGLFLVFYVFNQKRLVSLVWFLSLPAQARPAFLAHEAGRLVSACAESGRRPWECQTLSHCRSLICDLLFDHDRRRPERNSVVVRWRGFRTRPQTPRSAAPCRAAP